LGIAVAVMLMALIVERQHHGIAASAEAGHASRGAAHTVAAAYTVGRCAVA